ncbi:MAG: sugar phosphate isomerase/epimerase family protein [Bacteroidia bacterium]|nr:sugar phosphate isomerase/epimerase family protein [Bacteroidia bacterium]
MNLSRKNFLRTLGLGTSTLAGATMLPGFSSPVASNHSLILGLASYTLREFTLDQTIAMTQRVKLTHIALKSMHLPLESTESTIQATAKKIRDAGLNLYGAGVIYMKTAEQVDQAFAYAKMAGMSVIIGVPEYELLARAEEKVKETNIKLAIHNHGPGDEVYPGPDTIYEKIKNLDPRIGICMDIGHTRRIGQDPSAMAKKYASRLYDIHLKDVDKEGKDGVPVELGRGIIDIPGFLRTLQKIKYSGVVGLEYEKDGKDPLPGMAECVGYTHGVLDS